ncbi:hypothetical protein ALC57_09570 [Trachymyrmex cornetzi]|uniref:Uncharacterized protein n=1 Tax=Trachymyrmex cornetzi TaxID=471704 RepID=A0A151J5H9_9HYME|nr:hypothetical protein ALC57_09570 [Trachymyrmex cornetzi]
MPCKYNIATLVSLESEKKAKTNLQLILVAPQEEQDKVEKSPIEDVKKLDDTKAATQTQVMVLLTESSDVTQIYVLVKIHKQGKIQLLDNNGFIRRNYTLDSTRTLHRPQFRGKIRALDNIVLQFDYI